MKYSENYKVKSYDINSRNILRPSVVLEYMQETAEGQMRQDDIDYSLMYKERRRAFIVSRMNIELARPVRKCEEIESRTWYVPGRAANFPRCYEFASSGEVIMRANSNWALVDVDTKKLIRNKDYDMSKYTTDDKMELDIPERFRISKDVECTPRLKRTVTYSMTDINGHVNNTVYPDMLFDAVENAEEYDITSINIRFVHEARRGSEITVYCSEAQDPEGMDPRAEKLFYAYSETDGVRNVEAAFGVVKAEK